MYMSFFLKILHLKQIKKKNKTRALTSPRLRLCVLCILEGGTTLFSWVFFWKIYIKKSKSRTEHVQQKALHIWMMCVCVYWVCVCVLGAKIESHPSYFDLCANNLIISSILFFVNTMCVCVWGGDVLCVNSVCVCVCVCVCVDVDRPSETLI
jgi:hypothetical protein